MVLVEKRNKFQVILMGVGCYEESTSVSFGSVISGWEAGYGFVPISGPEVWKEWRELTLSAVVLI